MRSLFIYYRLASADAPSLRREVEAMQETLRARHPGLQAGLWRRPQEKDGMQTWMETYTHPAGVSAAIEADIAAAALPWSPRLQGPRHVEVFVPCA